MNQTTNPTHRRHHKRRPAKAPKRRGRPTRVEPTSGALELHPDGHGFLRDPAKSFERQRLDVSI